MLNIVNKEFPGTIINDPETGLPKYDPENRGRYLVHIPELMYTIFDTGHDGLMCTNHTHKWRDTYIEESKTDPHVGVTPVGGSYYPLKVGTRVIVKFFSEDYNSGYIDRIISDYYTDSMPLGLENDKRDDYYQIVRTSKNDLIAISTSDSDSDKLPKHSMHVYYNKDQVEIIFNEDGMFIFIKEDLQTLVGKEVRLFANEQVYVESLTNICLKAPIINLDGILNANISVDWTKCPCYEKCCGNSVEHVG